MAPLLVSAIVFAAACLTGMRGEASGSGVVWVLALVADAVLCIVLASQVKIGSPPLGPAPDCSVMGRLLWHKQLARLTRAYQLDAELVERGLPTPLTGRDQRDLAAWRIDQIERRRRDLERCGERPDPVDICLAFNQDGATKVLGELDVADEQMVRSQPDKHRIAWNAATRYRLTRSLEMCAQHGGRFKHLLAPSTDL